MLPALVRGATPDQGPVRGAGTICGACALRLHGTIEQSEIEQGALGQAQPEGGERALAQARPVAKASAKRSAKKAGRPYPSLVDNMNAAKKSGAKKSGAKKSGGKKSSAKKSSAKKSSTKKSATRKSSGKKARKSSRK